MDYTRLEFVDFCRACYSGLNYSYNTERPAICKAGSDSENEVVCRSSACDLCDFIGLVCACLYGVKGVSEMEVFTGLKLLVSSSNHRQASILRLGPPSSPNQAVFVNENILCVLFESTTLKNTTMKEVYFVSDIVLFASDI